MTASHIRILYVSAVAERGGAEMVLLNILNSLDRSRFEPRVLFLADGPLVKEVALAGTETHVMDGGRLRELRKAARAVALSKRLILSNRIDIVHSSNSKAHIYGGLAAALAGVPSVYHMHGVPRPSLTREGIMGFLSMLIPAQRKIACSHFVAREVKKAWWPLRISVVHNGVPLNESGTDGALRAELGIPSGAPLVVMVSRLQWSKGVHVFVDAAALVAKRTPEARFVVVGGTLFGLEARYEEQLRKQIERLGLSGRFWLVGHRSDVTRFYSAADVVVHSAIGPESFGMVLLEAMSHEKAVIASNSGGTEEIVLDGVTGVLVPPGDAQRLAQPIQELLTNRDRLLSMGRAGAIRVRECFSASRMVRDFQRVYEEMAASVHERT